MDPTDRIQPDHNYDPHTVLVDAETVFGQAAGKVTSLLQIVHRSFDLVRTHMHNLHQDIAPLVAQTNAMVQAVGADESASLPARQCVLAVVKLVSDLQYHDIIHQRVAHLQQINALITPVLERSARANTAASTEEALSLLAIIVQLQLSQFEQVEGEYQRVFRKMRETLADIKKNTLTAADTVSILLQRLPAEQAPQAAASMRALVSQLEQSIAHINDEVSPSLSFKNGVHEIKLQLKGLAKHLPAIQEPVSVRNQELLGQVEALYTMQSERETFRRVVYPKSGVISTRTGEGEVELF